MTFLFPEFLWALLGLSLPIIIHLFNFRRYKTFYFSNTRLLQSIEQKNRRVQRVRQWLILLLRLLFLTFLVLAFAQPVLPDTAAAAQEPTLRLSLYIDNSYSMELEGENGPLLNQARQEAVQLLQQLPATARVQVLSNSFAPQEQRFYPPAVALELVDQIESDPSFRTWSSVEKRIVQALQQITEPSASAHRVFFFSDLQSTAIGQWAQQRDSTWQWYIRRLIPVSEPNNLSLDSLWFEQPVFQPGFNQILMAKIQNHGNQVYANLKVQMSLNGQKIGFGEVDIPAQSEATVRIPFPIQERKAYAGQLQLNSRDAAFDNQLYFQFNTNQKAQVMIAGFEEMGLSWEQLFEDSLFQRREFSLANLEYGAIPSTDLSLLQVNEPLSSGLERSLTEALDKGQNVFLFPQPQAPQHLTTFLQKWGLAVGDRFRDENLQATKINLEDPYFEQVFTQAPEDPDLPQVKRYLALPRGQGSALLLLENGRPLIMRKRRGEGELFISAVPLAGSFSNLVNHPILNPILLNAALFQGQAPLPYLRAGNNRGRLQFTVGQAQEERVARAVVEEQEWIPPQEQKGDQLYLGLPSRTISPGNYPLLWLNDTLGYLALNLDARESELNYLSEDKLAAGKDLRYFEQEQELLAEARLNPQAAALWPWMILAAILSLVAEMILIKLWRP